MYMYLRATNNKDRKMFYESASFMFSRSSTNRARLKMAEAVISLMESISLISCSLRFMACFLPAGESVRQYAI